MTTLYENKDAARQAVLSSEDGAIVNHSNEDFASRSIFRSFNDRIEKLEAKTFKLESENRRLRAIVSAAKSNPPMDLGLALHAPGDMVPSHSAADLLDGNVYIFKIGAHGGHQVEPRVFRKNNSGKSLRAGDSFAEGVVDTTLRHECAPNSFCYIEIK